jgi:hypothetical protein
VNDLVKTYESSKIQESESAIVSPQVMVIWRVVPFSVQQGRCGQGWQVRDGTPISASCEQNNMRM